LTEEVQTEVLKRENISLELPPKLETYYEYGWISNYIKRIESDMRALKFSGKSNDCFLYDNAKYFHQGYTNFWDQKAEDDYPEYFDDMPITDTQIAVKMKQECPKSIIDYIDEWARDQLGETSRITGTVTPPLDWLDSKFSDDNKLFSYYMMKVIDFSANFSGDKLYYPDDFWERSEGLRNDRQLEYYEDLYYEALLSLHITYKDNTLDFGKIIKGYTGNNSSGEV
jgi:hypothetical protein